MISPTAVLVSIPRTCRTSSSRFYSGKGQEGRGLGLYIARQLLERHGYGIEMADHQRRVLPGANFVVSFLNEDAG